MSLICVLFISVVYKTENGTVNLKGERRQLLVNLVIDLRVLDAIEIDMNLHRWCVPPLFISLKFYPGVYAKMDDKWVHVSVSNFLMLAMTIGKWRRVSVN
jgi:hypothetical protein